MRRPLRCAGGAGCCLVKSAGEAVLMRRSQWFQEKFPEFVGALKCTTEPRGSSGPGKRSAAGLRPGSRVP